MLIVKKNVKKDKKIKSLQKEDQLGPLNFVDVDLDY